MQNKAGTCLSYLIRSHVREEFCLRASNLPIVSCEYVCVLSNATHGELIPAPWGSSLCKYLLENLLRYEVFAT